MNECSMNNLFFFKIMPLSLFYCILPVNGYSLFRNRPQFFIKFINFYVSVLDVIVSPYGKSTKRSFHPHVSKIENPKLLCTVGSAICVGMLDH